MVLWPFTLHSFALLCGTASFVAVLLVYVRNPLEVVRNFLIFLGSLFLFVLSFWLEALGTIASSMGLGDEQSSGTLAALAFLTVIAAGMLQIGILPHLASSVSEDRPTERSLRVAALSLLTLSLLSIAVVLRPGIPLFRYLLSAVLYGNIGYWIVVIRKKLRSNLPQESFLPPLFAQGARMLRGFIRVSLVFFPLFILDVLISDRRILAAAPALTSFTFLDNLSVPVYLILLTLGSVRFAYQVFDRSRKEGVKESASPGISQADAEKFGLTEREREIADYILEGYTLPDTARVLKISPKTAENHLYSVYRKCGVTNRMQLFNLFTKGH